MASVMRDAAFPGPSAFDSKGMSLRDWFAGQALSSLAGRMFEINLSGAEMTRYIAMASYEYADAMLAARQEVK